MAVRRLTRRERKEQTRRELLRAAKKVFLRKGFHGASLEDVAEEAGFTKGAVYSAFESKADLFLALLSERTERRVKDIQSAAIEGETIEAHAHSIARQCMQIVEQEREWVLVANEFRLYAARDARLRREFAAIHERYVDAVVALVEGWAQEVGWRSSLPPADIARAGLALGIGIRLERCVDVEGFDEDLYRSIFSLFTQAALADEGASEERG
jgi:AcrR family transcriptional regulator